LHAASVTLISMDIAIVIVGNPKPFNEISGKYYTLNKKTPGGNL
jgi:hypothetical protein